MSILRKKISVPLLFCSLNVSLVAAGLGTWSSAYEYDDVLPDGVKLFKTTVEEWPDLNAWLITADITLFKTSNGWDFKTVLSDDTSDNLSPIEQFASHFGAKIATNGGFFGVSSGVGKSYSLASGNNTLYSPNIGSVTRSGITYYPTRCAFGID
jgi:hypothetical protein